jgi:hypothetical protein
MEMLAALKARREALESKMKEKKRLLKELCIKEGKHKLSSGGQEVEFHEIKIHFFRRSNL